MTKKYLVTHEVSPEGVLLEKDSEELSPSARVLTREEVLRIGTKCTFEKDGNFLFSYDLFEYEVNNLFLKKK